MEKYARRKIKMWIRNTIIASILLALSSTQSLAGSLPETLVIGKGIQDYPPYHWTKDGTVVGLVPDIIRGTAKRLGIKNVTFDPQPWLRMLKMAERGQLDAVMPLYSTAERRKFLDFPKENLMFELLGFYRLSNVSIAYDGTLESLLPYNIGTITGYSYGSKFDSLDFKRIDTVDEKSLYNMLKVGRYQVGISDLRVLEYYSNAIGFKPVVLEPLVSSEPLYIGFSKKKQFGDFVSEFSEALSKFKRSPEYQKILDRYGLIN